MSLYSPSEQSSNIPNGSRNMTDGIGTIDPAALSGGVLIPQTNVDPSPRGTKRSRSPDEYGAYAHGEEHDEAKPRKRGRPAKTPRTSGDYTHDQSGALLTPSTQASPELATTPQVKSQTSTAQPVVTPTQSSPGPRATPKSTLKALPTVRDHTSDQLGTAGDEYIAREYDEQGEQKVNDMGYLQGGREYKIRTFTLPGRGDKLFMLATECARTLQYRDSYLLFNKNRSLFKIIASPKDKEELVAHDILPYSYRSRQIALVTARSMFRQFGSRVVKDGRRVRDDYWEAKARKQGFTEEDAAGEKRPGAARAREAAAAEALGHRQLQLYGNIVYANDTNFANLQPPPLPPGIAATMPQIPMMEAYDAKYRDVQRPRIENVGPAYNDVTRTSSDAEMASQASHAADYSKQVNIQGRFRKSIVEDYWHRPHDPPVSTPQPTTVEPANVSQPLQSPGYDNADDQRQSSVSLPQQQTTQTPMNPPSYPHPQNPMQSPQQSQSYTPSRSHMPRQSSGLHNMSMPGGNYSPMSQQQQGWGGPPPQPQQSPAMQNRMYNQAQFSPHMAQNQMPSPVHAQSPHPQQQQMQPPQYNPQMMPASMGTNGPLMGAGSGLRAINAGTYGSMAGMPQTPMYQQMSQGYMQQQQQQHGGQPQQGMYGGQQWQPNYQ
ncbi:hypothetical protein OHC33_000577 [Knufia fluminis]|uniref:Nuclear localization protein n=1 Tax=Knufia fluminis TaxID=191047 RepID=A0AAN8EM37_9EURO|nr:hypothetical protein OHC33_000577 [Knufia fluminis]